MDIRKKFFSIVGVLTLTMSMSAGIAAAQEALPDSVSKDTPINIVVNCSTGNATTGSVALNAGSADDVAFGVFDPAVPTTVATAGDAFRVDLNLGSCPGTTWSITASVTDFSTDPELDPVNTFAAEDHFQLPFGDSTSWMVDDVTEATTVNGPNGLVNFVASGSTNTGTQALAVPNGSATGSMFLVFGAQIVGLDGNVAEGDYSAVFTVTFNPSQP